MLMGQPDIPISQEIEEKTSQPMPWERVLFLQINRINESMTQLSGDFMSGIEALDMDLAFFHDEKYSKEMEDLNKQAKAWIATQKQIGGYIPQEAQTAQSFARAKEHMKILLRLMGRCGFYPESQGSWKGSV